MTARMMIARVMAVMIIGMASAALPGQSDASFGEVLDVRVVNLEVVVTDKDDSRVAGLRPDDFSLSVDGREIPIQYFTEIQGGTAVEHRDMSGPAMVPTTLGGEAVGTSFLIFIDETMALGPDRDLALKHLIEQLPLLGPADRMAVIAFNGSKLEKLTTWSQSTQELERVLTQAMERKAFGIHREVMRRRIGTGGGRLGRMVDQSRARRIRDHMRRVVLAATSSLRSFANPPGRKAMLLLAGGWTHSSQDMLTQPWPVAYQGGGNTGPALYRPLYDTANRLGYTLYPMDVRVFRVVQHGAEHATARGALNAYQRSLNREQSENATLTMLADQTGGRAFLDSGSRRALEQALTDTRAYYWLGFIPDWVGDDLRHRVKVHVRDPQLRVRSRKSFSDLSHASEVDMMVESLLLVDDAPDTQELTATLSEGKRSGFRKVTLSLEVTHPLTALTFLPSSKGYTTEAELRVAVEDKNGNRAEIQRAPLKMNHPHPPRDDDHGVFKTAVMVRRLRHDFVVSIYDKFSGKLLWTRVTYKP